MKPFRNYQLACSANSAQFGGYLCLFKSTSRASVFWFFGGFEKWLPDNQVYFMNLLSNLFGLFFAISKCSRQLCAVLGFWPIPQCIEVERKIRQKNNYHENCIVALNNVACESTVIICSLTEKQDFKVVYYWLLDCPFGWT